MSTPTYPPFTVERFLTVRSDSRYSRAVEMAKVLDWIEHSCGFERVASDRLRYRHNGLLLNLLATHADERGNYPGSTPGPSGMANLIELRCDDADEARRRQYEALAVVIARHLGWEVVDDREGAMIFRPESTDVDAALVVTEFWRRVAELESHYSAPPLAFEANLVAILRFFESNEGAMRPLCEACGEIVAGIRAAPMELVPFLMWRLRWPEIRALAKRLYDETPPDRRVLAVHLRNVLDAYAEHPMDEELFLAWLAAGSQPPPDLG